MERDKLLVALYAIAAIFLSLVIISIQYAPVFTIFILLICTTIVLYVLTEHWKTHDAIEFENRFWSLMAGILSWSCVFCSDSPFRLPKERSGLAWIFVITCAYLVHLYDRHLRSNALKQIPDIPRSSTSQIFDSSARKSAKMLLSELSGYQNQLDNKYISSFFQNIFNIRRVLHLEHKIIQIFANASEDELNIILTTAEIGLLFYKIKDHRVARFFNRTAFLKLLCVDRISELNVIAKVMLLDGIQKMKLSAHSESNFYVKSIILSTRGNKLSELKCLCDCKGDVNSFHKLIYRDLSDEKIRQEILGYIADEARMQREARSTQATLHGGAHRGKLAWRKVISDVDDTLTCSGGTWPAGIDSSYPRKTVYPGVLAFYRELDLGFHIESDTWDRRKHVGNLVFLSARPHVYKDVSEVQSYRKFRDLQEKRDLYTSPTLLAGSLEAGRQYMVRGNIEPVAKKKYSNLKEYLAIYPEYTCMYIGDNGQGDVRTAEMMYDNEKSSGINSMIERCYIHQVQPLHRTHTFHEETRRVSSSSKFFYFSTYVDAAVDAYQHKFIGLNGLKAVMQEAISDFEIIKPEQWRAAEESSLSVKVNTTATDASSSSSTSKNMSLSSRIYHKTSSAVSSRMSRSSVAVSTRPIENGDIIDDKESDSSESSSQANFSNSKSKYAHQYRRTTIEQVFNPELKIDARIREMNISLMKANSILLRENEDTVPLLRFRKRFARGALVRTLYGNGVVQSFRDTDGIYEIIVQWDASGVMKPVRMYLQGSSIKPAPLTLNPSVHVRRFRASANTVQVTIPTAVSKVDISWDVDNALEAGGVRRPGGSQQSLVHSNRSSPATTASTSATTSAPTTGEHSSASTTSLTLGAVARHNILAGLTVSKASKHLTMDGPSGRPDDAESSISSTTSTLNRMNPADVPLDKALEMAFLPNALARATGKGIGTISAYNGPYGGLSATKSSQPGGMMTATTTRARTMSETSDELLSSNVGEVMGGKTHGQYLNDRLSGIRGAQVWTHYGLGHVEDYRDKDDMIVVKLSWDAIVYTHRASIVQLTDPRHTIAFLRRLLKESEDMDAAAAVTSIGGVEHSESVLGSNPLSSDPPMITSEPPKNFIAPSPKLPSKKGTSLKPSIFPDWLGFWSAQEKSPSQVSAPGPDTNDNVDKDVKVMSKDGGMRLPCGIRFDESESSTVLPLIGLDVRTPFGFGTISRVFRDEDYPDEGGGCRPPVFIVLVAISSAPNGNHIMAYLSPDSVWTRDVLGSSRDGAFVSPTAGASTTPSVSSASSSSTLTASSRSLIDIDHNNSASLLESIVEDDEDVGESSPTVSTSTCVNSAWRQQLYTKKLSSYQIFL